ncbi:uncharacterized protein PG986_006429 [Apiospora aurea]|uniref:Uncharacterized protein n=1 Tax=Apiospora aurea TaxID=335848 RepID=A0ABR1QL76_9PEZI
MALEGKIHACLLSDEVRAAADTCAGHEDDGIVVHLANRDRTKKLEASVPVGVDERGTIVRIRSNLNSKSNKNVETIPLNDRTGGSSSNVTMCNSNGAPHSKENLVVPFAVAEADAFDKEVAAMIEREVNDVALPMLWPALADQLGDTKGVDGSILSKFVARGHLRKLSQYMTASAFEACPWAKELEGRLLQFQHNNPLEVLPIGILKVGLLNYWWQRS